jgi:glycosyltransferase involved in cell wall biosynthesis
MRVHVFGGVLAYDYLLTGWLRQAGVDAHYFFNYKLAEQDYPWWEDPAFDRAAMPEWCHFYPFRLPYVYRGRLDRVGRKFVSDFNRDADVLLVIGDGLFLAHHYTRPYVLWSCGFDVESAVPAPISLRGALNKLRGGPGPVRLQRAINRRHVHQCLQDTALVMTVMDFQVSSYLSWLDIRTPVFPVPMPLDCDRYQPTPDDALTARFRDATCVFFLPTRHSYGSHSTNDKGADKVIRAFARARAHLDPSVRLILVEKGERLAESKAAVEQLGISSRVNWIPELRKEDIKRWYSLPNAIVLDQFPNESTQDPRLHEALRRRGGRGSIFAEAMCMGRPLISNVGTEWIRELRPPMVWNACAEETILDAMVSAAQLTPTERMAGGMANRDWARREIHWSHVMPRYIELLARGASAPPAR